MKKVSLVTTLRNESSLLDKGLSELETFLQKFAFQWELILVVDPSEDDTLQKAEQLQSKQMELVLLSNPQHLGRGRSLRRGLEKAQGDLVMIFPLDFTIPLAEIFQFLQEMLSRTDLDLCVGNRNSSRKKREAPRRSSWHWVLENIISEKLKAKNLPVQDPLCPYLIFRSSGLQKILPELKMKHWYYTPEILQKSLAAGLKISEIPILSRDHKASQISLWREYSRHLF